MPKIDNFDEMYSHQPRKIDKKKHRSKGFSDDFIEEREQRVNFKKYIRQLREEESSEDGDDTWIVERGVTSSDGVRWVEVESFLTEEEAEDSAQDYIENDEYGDEYRVRKV